ncbi:capsular polysaccharide synthesis protein [Vagococcus sp. BWB3-3]|uniref:Capsular polysaccharide synthesis protein n=1 Tax=Vagococcus allomyrinae TaxID=2794353 RepID=A0A940SWV4_9ENTE|nr:capsular polysaccharide synthesis protein [Vagococcus allomyrinae]MBP1043665.1 capsular polysaccharide synthesis protein [Vagococcus allomyrinae]
MFQKLLEALRKKTLFESVYFGFQLNHLQYRNKKISQANKREENTYRFIAKKYATLLASRNLDSKLQSQVVQTKKIWICWLQGLEKAPQIVKVCVKSIKKYYPDYEIILITHDNLQDYVDFPTHIFEKRKSGLISDAHYSDLIRIQLLVEHGGIWMDATLFASGRLDEPLLASDLFVYRSSFDDKRAIIASSWLIVAKSNHPILLMTRELLFEYWRDHNVLMNYFLFHIAFSLACHSLPSHWITVPKKGNLEPHFLQFQLNNVFDEKVFRQILGESAIHKLTYKDIEETTSNSVYQFIITDEGLD